MVGGRRATRSEAHIKLPRLYKEQKEIVEHPAKRKVICCGRRAGKTTTLATVSAQRILKGKRVLYAVPVQAQANAYWQLITDRLAPLINSGHIYKNEAQRILRFGKEGQIQAKTAWDADSLRSDYADELMLDEFPLMDVGAWDEVGAPMMADTDGNAWFVGTPKRRNHFYRFFQRGMADGERWRSWQFSSHANPHLSAEALDELKADMTEAAYKQEILAEFLESEGQVFRGLADVMGAPPTLPEEHEGHLLAMGIDWGAVEDFTAWSIGCKDCFVEVAHDRYRGMDYVAQRARIIPAAKRWGVKRLCVESNSMGKPNIEMLQRDSDMGGVTIEPFATSAASKPPLIESLVLAIELGEFQWLDNPTWTAELEAYEVKHSLATSLPRYSAPQGMNDDTVIARCLMWRAMTHTRTYKFAAL